MYYNHLVSGMAFEMYLCFWREAALMLALIFNIVEENVTDKKG